MCPFVREEFVQQSESKRYELYAGIWLPSLNTRLSDPGVVYDACQKVNKLRQENGESSFHELDVCRDIQYVDTLLPIFPQSMKHSPVYYSHKIADATSIPLPWLIGILGLGSFDTKESEAYIANEHVKKSEGVVWSCMRGPYKSHSGKLKEIFDEMFSNSKKLKPSILSRLFKKK